MAVLRRSAAAGFGRRKPRRSPARCRNQELSRNSLWRGATGSLLHDGDLLRVPPGGRCSPEPAGLHASGKRGNDRPSTEGGSEAPGMKRVQLAIVGGGPAGLAAAAEAVSLGLSVALLDEQAAVGGQIYRHVEEVMEAAPRRDRKSTRLNSSHVAISYAVFCLKKKT